MPLLRVVHYNHTSVVAGAERVLLNLLPYLGEHKVQSTVISPPGALQQQAEQGGVPWLPCFALQARFSLHPGRLLRAIVSFARATQVFRARLRREMPDVVHANSVRAGIVATLATIGLQIPILWHVHDTLPKHPASLPIRALANFSTRTRILAVSQSTAENFAGSLWKRSLLAKTKVAHNFVTLPTEPVSQETKLATRDRVREELGLGKEAFCVGVIGQICKRKNQIALVEAFGETLKAVPDAELLIVGKPLFDHDVQYSQKLKLRIAALKLESKVHLLGQRSDVPRLLTGLDLLAVVSRTEPFPMIILEAMLAGVPVLAYKVDGIPEMIDDGQDGWLIPAGDQRQLARKMIWAAGNPGQRAQCAEAGFRRVQGSSSPQQYARTFLSALEAGREATPLPARRTIFPGQEGRRVKDVRFPSWSR